MITNYDYYQSCIRNSDREFIYLFIEIYVFVFITVFEINTSAYF